MTTFIRRLRLAIVFGGGLGGLCFVGAARSASLVQIHAPIIHTPTVHTPKANILVTNGIKAEILKTSTSSTTQTQSTGNPGTGYSPATNKGHGNDSDNHPQGVRFNGDADSSKGATVTIDGKTMPANAPGVKELMKEAETPPPKMWLNGKLVPITPANEQKADVAQVKAAGAGRSKTGTTNLKKGGGSF